MNIPKGTAMSQVRAFVVLCAALLIATGLLGAGPASAAQSRIVSVENNGPQHQRFTVYSASMDRNIPLDVFLPRDQSRPAPVLYMLNGVAGGEGEGNWADKTDYQKFFANKHVYVVTPLAGGGSYYTDWQRVDPKIGRSKWETFLLKELPPLLEQRFNTNGKNAIAGISMAGTSVLNLAVRKPGHFQAVAAYSGCAQTSDPIGQEFIRQVIEGRIGADMTKMWGPLNGPDWRRHDPYVNAYKLRGTSLYISSMSGLPGPDEQIHSLDDLNPKMIDQITLGGGIEAAMTYCTLNMQQRLKQLHVPATIVIRPVGTHSWGYWERELKASWPQIWAAIR
ncbi:alpha/beta hydrolase family protein [Gordonia sp. (in: high G+C Gram-positive bacteria)]|uniref:alpha/beta hydrolase n=1 Tax=Gordonia sp. (in: high G+C Gram-positive bacteria) TaxID=84139 RepID=UPI002633E831|nr:alpha/beta hydrolase family protein [Gordonia sp. (in: high G+C Gram-positive bacteria)]